MLLTHFYSQFMQWFWFILFGTHWSLVVNPHVHSTHTPELNGRNEEKVRIRFSQNINTTDFMVIKTMLLLGQML